MEEKRAIVVQCVSACLIKARLQLQGKSDGAVFVAAYAPTDREPQREKIDVWTALDGLFADVSSGEHIVAMMDANARSGKKENI